MRILVTGGAGFIGSHVVDAYVAAGHQVAVVDNLATGLRANVQPEAEFYELDVRSPQLADAFARFRPDVVNHHAAQASVPVSVDDPVADAEINLVGTVRLLDLAVRHGVRRFIFISTGGAIYGEPESAPCDESAPVRPLSPYGAAKASAEVYVGMYGRTFGLDFTILRYGNVYGPRMHFRAQEGLVVAIFATRMLRGEPVTVDGTGEQSRDFVYVTDCAAANVLASERGSSGFYNVGTGVSTSINTLFDLMVQDTGYSLPAQRGPARKGDVFQIVLDCSRARSELSWQPAVGLREGLRQTVEFFRSGHS